MTVSQFKELYPQFAHLEGNSLWNKMEDKMFETQKSLPEEVRDWKGNILKEGDEFSIVQVMKRQYISNYGLVIIDFDDPGKSTTVKHEEPRKSDEPYWLAGEFHKVEVMKYSRRLAYTIKMPGMSVTSNLSILNFDLYNQDQLILVIKGVSDKQEEYEQQRLLQNRL